MRLAKIMLVLIFLVLFIFPSDKPSFWLAPVFFACYVILDGLKILYYE